MHISKGLGRLLLLLTLLPLTTAAVTSATNELSSQKEVPVKAGPPAPVPTKNPSPGTKDAPVDGKDGKPHLGPNIPKHGPPSGSSPEKGVSAGTSSVDITKPPPVTGEHEIVDLEGKEGVGKSNSKSDLDPESNISKSVTTDPSGKKEDANEDDEHHDHEHHGKDKTKDKHLDDDDETRGPPINTPKDESDTVDPGTIVSPAHSFTLSFIMILFSEIGDKTFLIAALMAMKHARLLVFSAALASLIVMSILSAILGHAVPTLLSKRLTSFLAAALFLVFGVRMLREGLAMEKGTASVQEELSEVERELLEKEAATKRGRSSDARDLEEGGRLSTSRGKSFHRSTASPSLTDSEEDSFKPRRKSNSGTQSLVEGVQNLASLVFSPAWVQTFVMTFLGEWGDRSQIATIAMAAGQDYWWVTMGTICGHSLCTAGAVIGGRFLAERISVRNVTLGGACAFLVFGILYFGEALYM